jgi:hypothetical protein
VTQSQESKADVKCHDRPANLKKRNGKTSESWRRKAKGSKIEKE